MFGEVIVLRVDYQKLYAYLVGQVDDVLLLMGELDVMPLAPIREKLKNALLTAEEMHVEGQEKT